MGKLANLYNNTNLETKIEKFYIGVTTNPLEYLKNILIEENVKEDEIILINDREINVGRDITHILNRVEKRAYRIPGRVILTTDKVTKILI